MELIFQEPRRIPWVSATLQEIGSNGLDHDPGFRSQWTCKSAKSFLLRNSGSSFGSLKKLPIFMPLWERKQCCQIWIESQFWLLFCTNFSLVFSIFLSNCKLISGKKLGFFYLTILATMFINESNLVKWFKRPASSWAAHLKGHSHKVKSAQTSAPKTALARALIK
jgi:hypothetical protein